MTPHSDFAQRHPARVFISYCRCDRRWMQKLRTHLKSMTDGLQIVAWDDTEIRPGDEWKERIGEEIRTADVAILLVSADYLASDFIRTRELPLISQAARDRDLKVLPVLVSPSRFESVEDIARFQAVNNPKTTLKRVSVWQQEAIFVRVAEAVAQIADEATSPTPLFTVTLSPSPLGIREWLHVAKPDPVTDLAERLKDWDPETRATVLKWASADPDLARTLALDSYLPTPRQLPAAGGLILALERSWEWIVSLFSALDDNGKSALAATALFVSSLVPPVVVAHARRQRDLGKRPVPTWIPAYCVAIGLVASAVGGYFLVQYDRAGPAAQEAEIVLTKLRAERPAAVRELDVIWPDISDNDRQHSQWAGSALLAKVPQGRRAEIGDWVYAFAAARLAQEHHRPMILLLSMAAVLIGAENLVCSAMLWWLLMSSSATADASNSC